jgi:hypothetical protein
MAQYLPFIPDVLPEPVIYNPDFNFFDKMLQRKQALYEQGVSRAKSAYQSVHDVALSDEANIPLKDQYLKQAQAGLKKIAASDLSLPQNQQIAMGLYAPFWEDKMILQDATITKHYQSQAERLNAWKNSSDPKQREQYNGIVNQYLMNGLDVLKKAGRNADVYSKVEQRQAIPWTNLESYLEKAANEQKLAIKYDDPSSGPYLVSTENGERSKKKFSIWAQSMIGNNFYDQFNVTGIVEKEERIKGIKKDPNFLIKYPKATDQDVLNYMSNDVITELEDGFTTRKNEKNVEIARVNSLINSIPQTVDTDQENILNSLIDQRKQLEAELAGIDKEYSQFGQPDKNKIKTAVLTNPNSYFALLAKQRVINNWATGRASIESRTIKENTAWTAAQRLEIDRANYQLNVNKEEFSRQIELKKLELDQWKATHPTATLKTDANGKVTAVDANGNPIASPYDDVTSTGYYLGVGSTDITKSGSALDVYNKEQTKLFYGAYDMLYNPEGLLKVAKLGLGLSQEELSLISSYMGREMRSDIFDPTGAANVPSAKETAALAKLNKALLQSNNVKAAGITAITGPGTRTNALVAYAQEYFNDRLGQVSEGTIPLSEQENNIILSYNTALQSLNTYNANEKNRKDLIQKTVLNNPKTYGKIIVDRGGGVKDLITTDELAKDMPVMELGPVGGGSVLKLNKIDAAKAFMSGNLNVLRDPMAGGYEVFYEGKKYYVNSIDGSDGATRWANYPLSTAYRNKFEPLIQKYGTSTEFSNLFKNAQSAIVPNLLYYQSKTGIAGTEWSYMFDNKHEKDKAVQLFDAALTPANGQIYDADNKKIIDTDVQAKIRSLLANKENNMEKYIQGFKYKTLTDQNGKPAIQFSIVGTDDSSKEVAGTYNIVLNEQLDGQLRDLPQNTGHYIFGEILRGHIVKSDPILASSGFSWEIVPDKIADGNKDAAPTFATVSVKYKLASNTPDGKGGMIHELKDYSFEQRIDLIQGPNKKSPDELVNYMYQLFQNNMLTNKQKLDEHQAYLKAQQNNPALTMPGVGGTTQTQTPVNKPKSKSDILKAAGITL